MDRSFFSKLTEEDGLHLCLLVIGVFTLGIGVGCILAFVYW